MVQDNHPMIDLQATDAPAKYAVGMVQTWVRDFDRPFDGWGRKK